MEASPTAQGKHWVMQTFARIRADYPQVPVERVFPWRGGETFEKSLVEHVPESFCTYYLLFDIHDKPHHLTFSRQQLAACWHPANGQVRRAIEQQIRETFESVIAHHSPA